MRLPSILRRSRLPSRIKKITAAELAGLMDKRAADGLGFSGRRQWFSENVDSMEYGLLVPVMLNRATMLRCKVVVAVSGGLIGGFLIDLTRVEYAHLSSVAGGATREYLRRILIDVPLVTPPVEEARRASALIDSYFENGGATTSEET